MTTGSAADRVRNAAVEAFAELGFHGTTTRQIAARAGMSPAGVYVHFVSKEELLFDISRLGHEVVLAEMEETSTRGDTAAIRLANTVYAFVLRHARKHLTARVVNYELSALRPEHVEVVTELRRRMTRAVRAVVDDGVAAGEFHVVDPSMSCVAIISLGVDVARWYREDGRWTPEDVALHHSKLALRMVGYQDADE